jgi:hypothetical protein
MFSGEVKLENVKIKSDVFTKMGLPLEVVHGKIG